MSEETSAADEKPVTFHVKSSGNAKYTLTLPLSTTATDLKNKLATAEYANIPAESQRLIYSGRVLKDTDTLASHKVKEGNTMHLVKSAPSNQRQNPASSGSISAGQVPTAANPASSGVPSNLATGPGNNPLAGLTGARYAGFAQLPGAGMFGPDGGMGPPPGPEQMIEMMSNPQFAQMMNEALQNPQMIDMMIQQNPQLRAMGPQARQMLQSDQFRRMVTDPQALRSMAQLQRAMGMGPFAGMGQDQGFPAPGVTNTTAPENQTDGNRTQPGNQSATNDNDQPNPFAMFGGSGGALAGNPFAALFNPAFAPQHQTPGSQENPSSPGTGNTGDNNNNTTTTTTTSQPPPNPFAALFNPAVLGQSPQQNPSSGTGSPPPQQPPFNPFLPQNNHFLNNPESFNNLLQAMGGNGTAAGANPWQDLFGGLSGMGSPPAPPDNRPPEERFASQLRQLNDMGFYDFERNIQALTRSGGSVQGAIEHLLGGS